VVGKGKKTTLAVVSVSCQWGKDRPARLTTASFTFSYVPRIICGSQERTLIEGFVALSEQRRQRENERPIVTRASALFPADKLATTPLLQRGNERTPGRRRYFPQEQIEKENATSGSCESCQKKSDRCARVFFLPK
jgi:hypothetical protein